MPPVGERRIRGLLLGATALLVFLPLFFQVTASSPRQIEGPRAPYMFSGDGPHYLVMINSLLLDGDLEIGNNYKAVHEGADQAGARFKGFELDHHSAWVHEGQRFTWARLYEHDAAKWKRDPVTGAGVPTLRSGASFDPKGLPEYSMHFIGLPLLLAALIWPVSWLVPVETASLVLSSLAVLAQGWFLARLARGFGASPLRATVVGCVSILLTPIWHYGRTLFTEPFMVFLATAAYALALTDRRPALASALIGLGVLMKPTFAVFWIPLALHAILGPNGTWPRDPRAASVRFARQALPFVGALAFLALSNVWIWGSPFRTSNVFVAGNTLATSVRLLLDPNQGLLVFCPLLLLGIPSTVYVAVTAPRSDVRWGLSLCLLGFGLNYVVYAFNKHLGEICFGPRYLLPGLPFLLLGFALVRTRHPVWRTSIAALALLSFAIAATGAFLHDDVWSTPPLGSWGLYRGR